MVRHFSCVAAPQLWLLRMITPGSLRSPGADTCDARFTGLEMLTYKDEWESWGIIKRRGGSGLESPRDRVLQKPGQFLL